jgi:N-acetylglucosamine-6-sulfatase
MIILRCFWSVLCAACVCCPVRAAEEPRKPNVVLIISDDHRHDALGVVQREMGDRANYPFFETPSLDRLASGGVRFRNAFVTHSLCSPSRATMLTGRHSNQHGITHNAQPFTSTETWPALLGKNGWATGYFGKWHMGTQRERPGFEEVATFLDQGIYENCPFVVDGKDTPTKGWVDDVTTDYAIDFIKEHKDTSFAMVVGYKTPHDKRTPPPRLAEKWQDHEFPEPESFGDVAPWRKDNPPGTWNPKNPDRLAYFQTLAGMDENIGRLLDTLDAEGLADDTLVIYLGDNGYYLGEHGLGDKRTAYEESIRIPMILRYPRRIPDPQVRDELVLNLDLAATILDFCGLEPAWPQSGQSMAPLLAAEAGKAPWRGSFLYQNYEDPAYPKVTFDLFAVRDRTNKYVEVPQHPEWNQLFDLEKDPKEMRNIVADPAHKDLLVKMQEEMRKLKAEAGLKKP